MPKISLVAVLIGIISLIILHALHKKVDLIATQCFGIDNVEHSVASKLDGKITVTCKDGTIRIIPGYF